MTLRKSPTSGPEYKRGEERFGKGKADVMVPERNSDGTGQDGTWGRRKGSRPVMLIGWCLAWGSEKNSQSNWPTQHVKPRIQTKS